MTEQRRPWLIQRLRTNPYGTNVDKGVDKAFSMDYMGSAEFEFGTLPSTLKAMRSNVSGIVLEKIQIGTGKATIKGYFVGAKECLSHATEFFQDQLGEQMWRLKEYTNLREAYGLKGLMDYDPKWYSGLVGWWALDQERPWAIFKTDAAAREWKRLVYHEGHQDWNEHVYD